MKRPRQRGGMALPAALATVLLSATLAVGVAEIARVEVVIARLRRTAAGALAAADTCLARVLADVPAGWDFAATLAGPDGTAGTADDGQLAAAPGCTATSVPAPGPAAPDRVVVGVDARAGGGRRVLHAVAGRAPAAGVPALLWLSAPLAPGAVTGRLALDALDASGLAAPGDPEGLDAWLAGEGDAVGATAGVAPPRSAPPPPLAALADRLRAAGAAGPEALADSPPPATRALVERDLVVPGALHGAGLFLVDGVLEVQGSLDFSGVLAATGGVRVASGARLTLNGALWLGAGTDPGAALRVEGELAMRQDTAAVQAADALLRLPRLAVLFGLRDAG